MALTKKDVVEQVYNELRFPMNRSVDIVESLLEIIKSTLESGDDLLVSGFGYNSIIGTSMLLCFT